MPSPGGELVFWSRSASHSQLTRLTAVVVESCQCLSNDMHFFSVSHIPAHPPGGVFNMYLSSLPRMDISPRPAQAFQGFSTNHGHETLLDGGEDQRQDPQLVSPRGSSVDPTHDPVRGRPVRHHHEPRSWSQRGYHSSMYVLIMHGKSTTKPTASSHARYPPSSQ